jgi:hypothetical protein
MYNAVHIVYQISASAVILLPQTTIKKILVKNVLPRRSAGKKL